MPCYSADVGCHRCAPNEISNRIEYLHRIHPLDSTGLEAKVNHLLVKRFSCTEAECERRYAQKLNFRAKDNEQDWFTQQPGYLGPGISIDSNHWRTEYSGLKID